MTETQAYDDDKPSDLKESMISQDSPDLKKSNDTAKVKKVYPYYHNGKIVVIKEDFSSCKNLIVIRHLNKAKYTVYLVQSRITGKEYAMKVYPYKDDTMDRFYKNESRFITINNNNVIKMVYAEKGKNMTHKNVVQKASYILTEYATNGDLHDWTTRLSYDLDDRTIRTLFRQLIDGIEYLHKNGVAHLDLKLDNLLFDREYNVKIADFDLSYIKGDPKLFSKGTKFYRAPEFFELDARYVVSSESDSNIDNIYAADIYSAGIILFVLKSGNFYPYTENKTINGLNLWQLFCNDPNAYWKKFCKMIKKSDNFFTEDFKELFQSMVSFHPKDRISLDEIKKSKWYTDQVYEKNIYKHIIRNYTQKYDQKYGTKKE